MGSSSFRSLGATCCAALHDVHQPVESPPEFVALYPESDYNSSNYARRIYNGMHSAVEFVVKNVTEEMQAAELWDNSVFVRTIRHDKRNIVAGGRVVAPSDHHQCRPLRY